MHNYDDLPRPKSHVDTAKVRKALKDHRLCNVCTGWSPIWDGHDVNPPCYGWALEQLIAALDELDELRK